MKTKHIIVYTFESLEDPLIKGLILEYLLALQGQDGNYYFHLITHEHKEYALTPKQQDYKKIDLLKKSIRWYPIKYVSGNFKILKKVFNFLHTFFITLSIKLKYKPIAIVGFLAIAGGFSYILSRILNLKLIVYCFEPHSEYMADFKVWRRNGLKYCLLKRFEYLQIKKSAYIVIPNNHTKLFIENIRTSSNVFVCPISIDTNAMIFDPAARERIRNNLNITNKQVMIYTGKFGGIYFSSDVVINFFARLYQQNNNLFFYIITPNTEEIKQSLSKYKLPLHNIYLSNTVRYDELNQSLSAADIGFVALPPLPSQKYRTPVKTAMYLSCQLPYIVTEAVGEDDLIAITNSVGIVIENLNESPELIVNKITNLLSNDLSGLKKRCRNIAESTRSISVASSTLNQIFSDL